MPTTPKYWYFIDKANRDEWLAKAVSRGLQVKAGPMLPCGPVAALRFIADWPVPMVGHADTYSGPVYTIVDVDGRVGK